MKTGFILFLTVALVAAAAALLFYRRAPAQESKDAIAIEQLRAAGADLSKPHPLSFYLYVPNKESAQRVAAELSKHGFSVEVRTAAMGPGWLALATKNIVPAYESLVEIRRLMSELAEGEDGEYDGWEAQVVR